MKILVVDDEKSIRDLFTKVFFLALPGCRVDMAVNGEEGVDAFRAGQHDILVMDLYMPVKDGFTAFLEIQDICTKEGLKMPAVIFCTAYLIPPELQEIVNKDPRHCILSKPVNTKILMKELQARVNAG